MYYPYTPISPIPRSAHQNCAAVVDNAIGCAGYAAPARDWLQLSDNVTRLKAATLDGQSDVSESRVSGERRRRASCCSGLNPKP